MALIRTGALVQAISGSIGDATFHVTGGGGYVKRRGAGPRRRSELSENRGGNFQRASHAWSQLTPLERLAWSTAAVRVTISNRVGQQVRISGRALFMSINVPLCQIGQPVRSVAPLSPTRQGFAMAEFTLTTAGATMDFTTGAIPTGWCFIQGGRGFGFEPAAPRRYAQVATFAYSVGTSTFGFSVQWRDVLGYCAAGEKYYCRIRVLPEDQLWSPWQTFSGYAT